MWREQVVRGDTKREQKTNFWFNLLTVTPMIESGQLRQATRDNWKVYIHGLSKGNEDGKGFCRYEKQTLDNT